MHPYEQQLERTRRYYKRFQAINDGLEATAPSEHYIDDMHAFFSVCYHIKDYLKNDPAFKKHTDQAIEAYVTNTQALAICADICNGQKHLALTRPPRSGGQPQFGKRTIAVGVGHSLAGDEVPQKLAIQLEVEHAGNKLNAFAIASDAMNAWEVFVA